MTKNILQTSRPTHTLGYKKYSTTQLLARPFDDQLKFDENGKIKEEFKRKINSSTFNVQGSKFIGKDKDKFETILFLPETEGRKGEGGLRTKGYFKYSYVKCESESGWRITDLNNNPIQPAPPKIQERINDYFSSNASHLIINTSATINTIHTMAQNIQTMEDGRAKDVEVAKMIDIMSAQIEPSMWQKIDLFQTMMQLLNPKTLIRNVVGNAGFSLAEYISDQVAVPLDKFASMITKTDRTKFFTPGQKASTQWKGFKKGISLGFEDAVKGIDTTSLDTQYDLPKSRVFREGILADLELLLNVGLRVTDRGSYIQAFEDELRELMLMEGVSKPTPEMLEYAHHKGLYRTFQDANLISDMAVKTKQLLSHIGKDGFGVGSFLLKYPKTPANLIARGVDYTFVNAGIQVFKMIQQARKGELTLYSKKAMVEGIARGVTGTVAVGLGYVLARAGVISGTPDDEEPWRISSFRRSLGLRDYSINIDALIRWVSSGLRESQIEPQPGDTYMTYDWFQPSAISIAMGADMYRQEQLKDVVSTGLGAVASGANTLIQQPLLQGITDVLSARSLEEGVMNFSEGILSSFTPTLFSQMAYLIDPTVRNPRDMESNLKTALNLSIKKIPFLSQTLPAYYDQFGNKSEYDFGSSFFEGLEGTFGTKFFNSFFAPAIMGEFNPTVEEEKVLNLIRNTGESRHVPKYLDKKWTVQTWQNQEKTPVDVVLTPEEYEELSKWAGEQAKIRYREEIERYGLGTLDDYEQVDILNDILNDVRQGVRDKIIEMRGYEPY